MNEEDMIYNAWRESEAYGVPMTNEQQALAEQRYRGFKSGWLKGVKAEREACAKVCDDLAANDKLSNYYAVAARAIRARGEK